jgi:hypothetical protein
MQRQVYVQRDPGVLVRIKGQAPLAATVYELEKLRCNLCGNVYPAKLRQMRVRRNMMNRRRA